MPDTRSLSDLSAAQRKFLNEYVRTLLVQWAAYEVENGSPHPSLNEHTPSIFVRFALEKGWVTKRSPRRLSAGGWGTAASFLKR